MYTRCPKYACHHLAIPYIPSNTSLANVLVAKRPGKKNSASCSENLESNGFFTTELRTSELCSDAPCGLTLDYGMCAVVSSNVSRECQPPITDSLETAVISFLLSTDIPRNQALGHPYLFNLHSHHQDGPGAQRRKQRVSSH